MRVLLLVPAAVLLLQPAATQAEVVEYECTVTATGEVQDVKVEVELTVPTDAEVDVQMSIGWRGSYVEGSELRAPATGLAGEVKLYAYAGISGIPGLTSATGVAPIATIDPGEPIPLPTTTVDMKTTPRTADTGTVHAASVNFGPSPSDRLIDCEPVENQTLKEYPLTISGAGGETSPEPTPEPSTDTSTEATTEPTEPTAEPTKAPTKTPSGAADTGGGGTAGPDGRVLVGAGSLLVLAATTGLFLRRRGRVPTL